MFSDCTERVYADSMFGPSNDIRFSVVQVDGNDKSFCTDQMLLLFHLKTLLGKTIIGKFAFVRCFDIILLIDNIDRILNYLCLRWASEGNMDYIVCEDKSSGEHIEIEEWFSVI